MALKTNNKVEKLTFYRLWKITSLVLELSAGTMAILNVSFIGADEDIECEDKLLGQIVLQNLGIDSRKLLETHRTIMDGTD